MSSILYTAALIGLDCKIVEVEVDYRKGNTHFSVVGLADKSIQEAKDRIPAAIKNSGAEFVPVKIIMNLAPAELPKSGPHYDLPLTIGYLIASDQLNIDTEKKLFIGELSLDGRLRPVNGVLPIADSIYKQGFEEIYLPEENAKEASLVPGLRVIPVRDLRQLIDHLREIAIIEPYDKPHIPRKRKTHRNLFDLAEVKGQLQARRALEVAAAGGHNILMSGVPGSGKTMVSRCLPGILPSLTLEESLEVTRVYSIAGLTSNKDPMVNERPFRSPHHTSSQVALVGGGGNIRPGEISLSHRGVLFLDEFPEYSSKALESLRQPLEDKIVTISRASGSLTFPANFMLVAAMNPCKCGHLGDPDRECTCSPLEIQRYQKKISGPILDRIDLLINVHKVTKNELFYEQKAESSELVRSRVQEARDIQLARFEDSDIYSNSEMSQIEIKKFIQVSEDSRLLLQKAVDTMRLSARSYYRILKVSRTIADLDKSDQVGEKHIMEALSYRVNIAG